MEIITAEKLYQQSSEVRKEDIAAILEWGRQQPHFPEIDEIEAIISLYSSYNSLETAKVKLEYLYSYNALYPEIYCRDLTDKVIEQLEFCVHHTLEEKTPEGYSIIYTRFLKTNSENIDAADQIKILAWSYLLFLFMKGLAPGHIIIIDFEEISLHFVTKMRLNLIKIITNSMQDCDFVRPIAVHLINVPSIAETVIYFLKQFLNNKYIKLVQVHSKGLEEVYKTVPKKILPKVIGGDGPTLQEMQDTMKLEIKSTADYMKNFYYQKRIDESKRPEKSKQQLESLNGISGSFRKLEID